MNLGGGYRFLKFEPFDPELIKLLPHEIDVFLFDFTEMNDDDLDKLLDLYKHKFTNDSLIIFTGILTERTRFINKLKSYFEYEKITKDFYEKHEKYLESVCEYNYKQNNFLLMRRIFAFENVDIDQEQIIKTIEEDLDDGKIVAVNLELVKNSTKKDLEMLYKNLGFHDLWDSKLTKNKLQKQLITVAKLQS
jgi:hypothetical protein